MTIRDKQFLFTRLFCNLVARAEMEGFQVLIGMVYRSPEESARLVASGVKAIQGSLHELCLAGHLELFDGGEYVQATETFRPLGEWWEQQHELCRWGGRFGDGCHFSITHNGKS